MKVLQVLSEINGIAKIAIILTFPRDIIIENNWQFLDWDVVIWLRFKN